MIKRCENMPCPNKAVPNGKYCCTACRVEGLIAWNRLHAAERKGPLKKKLADKYVNITVTLTPDEAAVMARKGGASGELPQKTRFSVRKGIKRIIAECVDEQNRDY